VLAKAVSEFSKEVSVVEVHWRLTAMMAGDMMRLSSIRLGA
jgi:hypothetical protein